MPCSKAHYPVALNQAYAATKWVDIRGKEIRVDGKRLAVAGISVGGNIAAVVSLMAKDKKEPEIKLQVLLWPLTDSNFNTESYKLYCTGRFLSTNMMKWFCDNYTMDANHRKEIYVSPLLATNEQLKGLPGAFVQTNEKAVFRDKGEGYGRKLSRSKSYCNPLQWYYTRLRFIKSAK